MKRKVTNIVICIIVLVVLIGAGIGIYWYYNHGPVVGRIEYGKRYYLTEIRPSERFAGATFDPASYLLINENGTGEIYLKNLTATTDPIRLIVTNYKEGIKETIIDIDYLVYTGENGKDTQVQHLTAVSTKNEIRIKAKESSSVRIIQQKPNNINSLEYEVTLLVFSSKQEAA